MWITRFVRGAWRTLPVETLVVALAALGAVGLVHDDHQVWWLRLLLTGVVVTPLAFAAHRLGRRIQIAVTAAVLAGTLGALAVSLTSTSGFDTAGFSWPFRLVLLAAMLVPFVAAGRGFTHFVRRFFEETTTWGLLWLGALAAIGVVVVALKELFDLRVEQLGGDAVIAMTCAVILVYLDRLLASETASPGRMPELWRRLATTIGAPFVSVMLVILVAYEALAIARGELPRNMLSPLILGAGFVGFVSTLIVSSVLGEPVAGALQPADRDRWARAKMIRLAQAFPIVLLVLLPMAGVALFVRVDEYGLTPFRVVRALGLICLGVLSLAGAIRWLRKRAPLTWQVPAAIIGFALIAAFGPFSAVNLTVRSQSAQLARRLDALGAPRTLAASDAPTRRIALGWTAYNELSSNLRTLRDLGGEPAIHRVLSGELGECSERWRDADCLKRLGIFEQDDYEPRRDPATRTDNYAAFGRFPAVAGELALFDLSRNAGDPTPSTADADVEPPAAAAVRPGIPDGLGLAGDRVVVYAAGAVVARASLAELLVVRDTRRFPPRLIPALRPDGSVAAELAVHEIVLRFDGSAAQGQALRLTGAVIWHRD